MLADACRMRSDEHASASLRMCAFAGGAWVHGPPPVNGRPFNAPPGAAGPAPMPMAAGSVPMQAQDQYRAAPGAVIPPQVEPAALHRAQYSFTAWHHRKQYGLLGERALPCVS